MRQVLKKLYFAADFEGSTVARTNLLCIYKLKVQDYVCSRNWGLE